MVACFSFENDLFPTITFGDIETIISCIAALIVLILALYRTGEFMQTHLKTERLITSIHSSGGGDWGIRSRS